MLGLLALIWFFVCIPVLIIGLIIWTIRSIVNERSILDFRNVPSDSSTKKSVIRFTKQEVKDIVEFRLTLDAVFTEYDRDMLISLVRQTEEVDEETTLSILENCVRATNICIIVYYRDGVLSGLVREPIDWIALHDFRYRVRCEISTDRTPADFFDRFPDEITAQWLDEENIRLVCGIRIFLKNCAVYDALRTRV